MTLETFAQLDDFDIMCAVKVWQNHSDKILSFLCKRLINRELFKIELSKEPFSEERIQLERESVKAKYDLNDEELSYFVYSEKRSNNAYNKKYQKINILMKNGEIIDISQASDNLNISALSQPVAKYCLCYPV